jgi:serine/threonine protein kinase
MALSFSGTLEFIAPEIIKRLAYSFEVDFWSLGCLIYYMIIGKPPFAYENKKELLESILYEKIELKEIPSSILSDSCKDLI